MGFRLAGRMSPRVGLWLLVVFVLAKTATAQDRLPPIPAEKMTPEQKKAADEFRSARGTKEVFGPFVPLLRSPGVMGPVMTLGDYLRFKSSVPTKLNELAIIITARHWTQQYEWNAHYAAAIKAGLDPQIGAAIADGRRPEGLSADEQIVYDFATELLHNQSVTDRTFDRAKTRFGEQGVIDLAAAVGYYTFQSFVMNTARTSLPAEAVDIGGGVSVSAGSVPRLVPFPK